jgi:hypothetical protein
MKYFVTKHIEGMDEPMFRINYDSKYHTGSYPIFSYQDAINFICDEFGIGKLSYAMDCFRTEVAELLYHTCKEMEEFDNWKANKVSLRDFFNSFKNNN